MNKTFEVGKSYYPADAFFDPITVIKRTPKMITVNIKGVTWRMRIRTFANGIEYAVDSTIPKRHRDAGTYSAAWEAN